MTGKSQWTMLTAVLCIGVLAAGWMLLVHPQNSRAAQFRSQTVAERTQVQSLHAQLAMLQEESTNLASEEAQLARIAAQLPADPQLPTLLRKLDRAATATGVELVNVAPGQPTLFVPPTLTPAGSTGSRTVPTTGTSAAAGSSSTTKPATAGSGAVSAVGAVNAPAALADIPVVFSINANYFQLERFVNSLEGLSRSMLVNSFSISYSPRPSSSSGTAIGHGDLNVTVNAEVFMSTAALASAGSTGAK